MTTRMHALYLWQPQDCNLCEQRNTLVFSGTPNLACKAKMRRSAALGRGWRMQRRQQGWGRGYGHFMSSTSVTKNWVRSDKGHHRTWTWLMRPGSRLASVGACMLPRCRRRRRRMWWGGSGARLPTTSHRRAISPADQAAAGAGFACHLWPGRKDGRGDGGGGRALSDGNVRVACCPATGEGSVGF